MDPDVGTNSEIANVAEEAAAMRAEAAEQLKSARELAKRVRTEAVRELEDARERVARIAAREEEMAERWAQLLEAENALAIARGDSAGAPTPLVAEAEAEARRIIAAANEEARQIREQAMHLLGMAEGEKAESREIAHTETERAAAEAEALRQEAAAEARRLREEAEAAAHDSSSIYAKRGRKLPRIGENASNLLSEMGDLRARSAEDDNRQVV
jgi:hypothetical protein